jgi:hypothetical protein
MTRWGLNSFKSISSPLEVKRKSASIQYVVVDITESPINRPKKGQKEYYSGKKRHTLKTQVIIERNSLQIIDVQEAKGSKHDFKVYKDTRVSSTHWTDRQPEPLQTPYSAAILYPSSGTPADISG